MEEVNNSHVNCVCLVDQRYPASPPLPFLRAFTPSLSAPFPSCLLAYSAASSRVKFPHSKLSRLQRGKGINWIIVLTDKLRLFGHSTAQPRSCFGHPEGAHRQVS